MAQDFVFPEDSGTGAAGGDNADAANFATLAYAVGIADRVVNGLDFANVDYTNLTFDVNAGLCVVTSSSAQEAQTTATRDRGVAFSAIVAGRSGISLTDGAVNEVFVNVDLSTDDTISITVTSDGTTPSQPYLKLGEIDTSNDEETLYNRVRTPVDVYSDKSNVPQMDTGQFVFVEGEDRYYYENGN